ncbi:hypothetical protein Tco_1048078, partial [Tanacetum coccineum]
DGRPEHYYGRIHQARGRKARKRGNVYNCETTKYGKIWYDEDVHDLRSVETEFPAIVFNDNMTSNETLSCEPTKSSLNNNEIDFRISFDESDDKDYTVVFDKSLFSYKIISANDLKTDSENNNEKINMPLFPSPKPSVSCIDDLDFFIDFENEFLAIIYNDALMYKSDFSTEPTLCPQHIDEFDLEDETSLSEYDEVEQNVLYFNYLFPFNIIYPDDLKSDKDNDDNEIDMIQSSGGNENTQGSNNLLEGSHDKINKVFIMKSFVMELNVNIVAWNYLVNRMLFNLIKNLYVPFGIPFDPKRYYKDGDCTRMLRRPRARFAHRILHNLFKSSIQATMSGEATKSGDKLQTFNLHVKANDIKQNKTHLTCGNCGMSRHTTDQCFELIGYPDWWNDGHKKGNKNRGLERGKASAANTGTDRKNSTGLGGMAATTVNEEDGSFSMSTTQNYNIKSKLQKSSLWFVLFGTNHP